MSRRTLFCLLAIPFSVLVIYLIATAGAIDGRVGISAVEQFGDMLSGLAYMTFILCGVYLIDWIEYPEIDFLGKITEDSKALAIFLGLLLIAFALAVRPGLAQDVPYDIADTARTDVGVTETPPGSNTGDVIDQCLAHVNLNPGYPYCAACASMWADRAGIDGPIGEKGEYRGKPIRSALSADFINARLFVPARKVRSYLVQIPRGSIGIYLKGNTGHGHTVVVWGDTKKGEESWKGRCGYTIEANTSPSREDASVENQRDGDGIWGPKKRCINPQAYFRLVGFAVPLT